MPFPWLSAAILFPIAAALVIPFIPDAGDGKRVRWYALGVYYEMAGKDLIDSIKVSSRICQALGALPPDGFNYELFLDDKGEKISK